MQRAGRRFDAGERIGARGQPRQAAPEKEPQRRESEDREDGEAGEIGYGAPQAEPGQGDEERGERQERCDPRPDGFPRENETRTAHRPVYAGEDQVFRCFPVAGRFAHAGIISAALSSSPLPEAKGSTPSDESEAG
ncbi:MAG: hypothetical protein J0H63_14665 [Rhizobiales bacterium]|nr:hypothetical protein [Hyphomicrobiales bacterium]